LVRLCDESVNRKIGLVVFLEGGPPNLRQIELDKDVGSFVPATFRYLSFGLSGSLAEDWLAKPQSLVAALAACMRSKAWDRVEHKLQCMRRALGEKDPARQYLLTRVVENYLVLEGEERDRYEAAFAKEKANMVPFPLTFEEALEESEARGEARGELRATCEAILRLVERRFGQIPAAFAAQLAAISEPRRLRLIFDRALEAQSFDQLQASLG
jgi:hypothetical protein